MLRVLQRNVSILSNSARNQHQLPELKVAATVVIEQTWHIAQWYLTPSQWHATMSVREGTLCVQIRLIRREKTAPVFVRYRTRILHHTHSVGVGMNKTGQRL